MYLDVLKPEQNLDIYFSYIYEIKQVGNLQMYTGKLVVEGSDEEDAFVEQVPSGNFPVYVSSYVTGEEKRVMAIKVEFSTKPVICYQQALRPGENGDELEKGEFFAFEAADGIVSIFEEGTNAKVQVDTKYKDGFYPCYFGYDKDGKTCSMIVQVIDPEDL